MSAFALLQLTGKPCGTAFRCGRPAHMRHPAANNEEEGYAASPSSLVTSRDAPLKVCAAPEAVCSSRCPPPSYGPPSS